MDASRLEKRRTAALEEIRAAAWKQIGEKGAVALSLRAIGREMGLAATAIYYYYKDRDALVTALLMDAFTAFGDALEAARDSRPPGDYAGRFRLMCKAYFTWAAQNPQRYALMFGTPIEGYLFARELGPVAQRSFLVLLGLIGRAHAAGKITGPWSTLRLPGPLRTQYESLKRLGMPHQLIDIHLALSVWTTLHGITSLYLYHYMSGFLQQDVETFVDYEIDKIARMLGLASSEKNDASE
jgi:AcrR family transcriptional regulator